MSANIPIFQRLSAETGFDLDWRPRPAVKFTVISDPGWALLGADRHRMTLEEFELMRSASLA
jgi:hypothetical protein